MEQPKHIVAVSGGKDSTALALALADREPRDYEYICTPTGNELPPLFVHLDRLESMLGKPMQRIGIGKNLHELIDEMGMLPNFRARFCTRILKIEPAIEYMKALPKGSILYVGLRADEPMREGIYGDDVVSDFPFRRWGWGIGAVYNYLRARGITVPVRTDCGDCYHQRIIEWRNYWRDYPELYAKSVALEQKHGHTFRSPGRDTWPLSLAELAKEFERARPIRGEAKFDAEKDICRVCSL